MLSRPCVFTAVIAKYHAAGINPVTVHGMAAGFAIQIRWFNLSYLVP